MKTEYILTIDFEIDGDEASGEQIFHALASAIQGGLPGVIDIGNETVLLINATSIEMKTDAS